MAQSIPMVRVQDISTKHEYEMTLARYQILSNSRNCPVILIGEVTKSLGKVVNTKTKQPVIHTPVVETPAKTESVAVPVAEEVPVSEISVIEDSASDTTTPVSTEEKQVETLESAEPTPTTASELNRRGRFSSKHKTIE